MWELTNLRTEAERAAASRSRVYQLLRAAFAFPDTEFFTAIRDGSLARRLHEACVNLPYDVLAAIEPLRTVAGTAQEFESEYIRLFDVGPAGPPCPLYGGTYGGDRMKVMEEAVRFYNYFGLHLSQEVRELPDHITTELEFLHYLTFREVEVRQQGGDPVPLLRAQRDFLARHLCKWVPKLRLRLIKQETNPFFLALVDFAVLFFSADEKYATVSATEQP